MALIFDLVSFLNADTSVASAFSNRIHVDHIPDGSAYPHARIRRIDTDQRYTQDGEGNELALFQIDVYDDDRVGIETNAGYIKAALSGYSGVMGDSIAGRVFIRNVRSDYSAETKKYWKVLEAEIGTN